LQPCDGLDLQIFHEIDKMHPSDFPDEPFEEILRRRFAHASEDEKRWALSFVQGFHAADPARISTHSIIVSDRAEHETDGDRGFHIVGGYIKLIQTLRNSLPLNVDLRTSTVVAAINWSGETIAVTVRTRSGEVLEFRSPHVVLTLPLGVLQMRPPAAGAVHFDPPLAAKQAALQKLAMGSVVRLVLQFDSMFWEDPAALSGKRLLKDLHFLFTRDKVFPTYWSSMPLRVPVLVAWAAGLLAAAKRNLSHQQLETEALAALARILARPEDSIRRRFVRSFYHDWQQDAHSQGAYSYVLAGGMGAQRELGQPLGDKLFFAGEATQSDGHHATVHGAFASGRRVANEVLQCLKVKVEEMRSKP
jgi:monoamine oxidase